MINRYIKEKIKKAIQGEKKVIVIYGPRQSGKTTLINEILKEVAVDFDYFTGDDLYAQEVLSRNELEELRKVLGKNFLVVDEAQKIDNIGDALKLAFDNLDKTIIVSGSASFDLANKLNEPLTGRTKTFWLYPLAFAETAELYRRTAPATALEEMLVYGMYPKAHTFASRQEKEEYLAEYLNNYLYNDLLALAGVRKPKKVVDLLTLLAFQIGQEVKISELAANLAISQPAVEGYLDVLEKMFVVWNLRGFSRNLRKEISKTSKYYFVDTGLRNALIRNFNPLKLRPDAGELFENWFVMEKVKASAIFGRPANFYFWRTYDQQEIDLVEERGGRLIGYEVKWGVKKVSEPLDWRRTYANAEYKVVNRDNFAMELAE